MKKTLMLGMVVINLGLYGHTESPQTSDYVDELALMKDFLNLRKKTDQPLSYWLDQLVKIFEKKGKKKVAKKIHKAGKKSTGDIFKVLAENQSSLDTNLRLYLLKFGVDRARETFEQRIALCHKLSQEAEESTVISAPEEKQEEVPLETNDEEESDEKTDSTKMSPEKYIALSAIALIIYATFR